MLANAAILSISYKCKICDINTGLYVVCLTMRLTHDIIGISYRKPEVNISLKLYKFLQPSPHPRACCFYPHKFTRQQFSVTSFAHLRTKITGFPSVIV